MERVTVKRNVRYCTPCSAAFKIPGQHAKHMRCTHNLMVLEVVNINLGRPVHYVLCANAPRMIEKTVRDMLINMDRERYFVREFGQEAYDSSNHGDTETP